ncbi:MAG: hypothetical protein ACR2KG_00390 [Nocardioidaceae bacterium]
MGRGQPNLRPGRCLSAFQLRDDMLGVFGETVIKELTTAALAALDQARVPDAEAVTAQRLLAERATDRTV